MKTKIKNYFSKIIYLIVVLSIILFMTTSKATNLSGFSALSSLQEKAIGSTISLGYNDLINSKDAYCIQHGKAFWYPKRTFTVCDYIEIDGNVATIYTKNGQTKRVINKANAEMAYILQREEGYGTATVWTKGQKAIWHMFNNWIKNVIGKSSYVYYGNDQEPSNNENTDAKKYSEKIETITKSIKTENKTYDVNTSLKVEDATDKDNLTVLNTGDGYNRVGPFRWNFEGKLDSIEVEGISGTRIIKYDGNDAKVVSASDISTGEAFYIDISTNNQDITSITLKLKTSGEEVPISSSKETEKETKTTKTKEKTTIYNARIWLLKNDTYQNILYVEPNTVEKNRLVIKTDETENGNETTTTIKPEGQGEATYNIELKKLNLSIVKVDDRDGKTPLQNVGFKIKAEVYKNVYDHTENCTHWNEITKTFEHPDGDKIYVRKWVIRYLDANGNWDTENEENATIFRTNKDGQIAINNISYEQIKNDEVIAIEVENPYYGYEKNVNKQYTISGISNNSIKTLNNHQDKVKLSGYVWIDETQGKQSVTNNLFDKGEVGFNGIKVYLKDQSGNTLQETSTNELGIYDDIEGGEYRFVDVNLDELAEHKYHIEFEYCGIYYQSVPANLSVENGSKAIDTNSRKNLDSQFKYITSDGNNKISAGNVSVTYNRNEPEKYKSQDQFKFNSNPYDNESHSNHKNCEVIANTLEAGYDLFQDFEPTTEEIRNINLGLFIKGQADFALAQDLYNVRVTVNGYEHIYRYANTRYKNNGNKIDEDSSWNVGVKFQNNRGTYNRAIYYSDVIYKAENHKSNELKVYITYKVTLKNESIYLGRINNIIDYSDNRFDLVGIGTDITENDSLTGNEVEYSNKESYNDKFSKYIINTNSVIKAGESTTLYVQYQLNKQAVLTIMNNGELLNNLMEINSYTTFKGNNANDSESLAVIDQDSVPGNAIPENVDTYEDDTDIAKSLKLELKEPRDIQGTVFVDETGKLSNEVYSGQERKGNGIFDNGEKGVKGVQVKLIEVGKDGKEFDGERAHETNLAFDKNAITSETDETKTNISENLTTETDENGNFTIKGFLPGKYVIVYIWGDKTYKVQYYKGTIYDESRNQEDNLWYKDSVDIRKTDALDDYKTREKIDDEMEKIYINTIDKEIENAYTEKGSDKITVTKMPSISPVMDLSVEYDTTTTDATGDEVKFIIKNVDFGIVERPKQQLSLNKRITAFKVTLPNGQILVDATIDKNGKLHGTTNYSTYMPGLVKVEIDNELLQGSKAELTYEITVKNTGELDYTSDKYYYYGNSQGAEKIRVSAKSVLDYVDSALMVMDDNFKQSNIEYAKDVNARHINEEDYLNRIKLYATEKLAGELNPGDEKNVTINVSKDLTTSKDISFDNQAEIVEAKKQDNIFNAGTPLKVKWDDQASNSYFETADAEKFVIVPSTGENKDYVTPTVVAIVSISILAIGIVIIKKFVIK